jgi:hypothetical protein
MAKTSRARWNDWRISEDGRSIKSSAKRDKARKPKARERMARSWWWTLAPKDVDCDSCGDTVDQGAKVAYRHKPKVTYCPGCASDKGVGSRCRTSKRLRAAKAGASPDASCRRSHDRARRSVEGRAGGSMKPSR